MAHLAVDVRCLSKTFKLPHERPAGFREAAIHFRRSRRFDTHTVLSDLSFTVHQGEFFGIVGRNGSGKSTLLKLLAGILAPDAGTIEITGNLTPFIELGVGFNLELTARDNVFLNGALLGFNRRQMRALYGDIVEFSELGGHMDQKLKNFSSGMQVRLAFSIAVRADSDILLMDEVLAVGDAAFQRKCLDVFRSLKSSGRTIILVTHDMTNVERFCDRALVLDYGSPVGVMSPSDAASYYYLVNSGTDAPTSSALSRHIAQAES